MKNVPRAQLRGEWDAYYVRLSGLTHDELRYTPYGVDPKEVHGEDSSTQLRAGFPGKTFRVLKEKETRQFGKSKPFVLRSRDSLAQPARAGVAILQSK